MGSMGCQGCGLRAVSCGGGGNPDCPAGTAKCGPACLVVWEPGPALWVSHRPADSHRVVILSRPLGSHRSTSGKEIGYPSKGGE